MDTERLADNPPGRSDLRTNHDGRQFAMLTATPLVSLPGLGMVLLGVVIFVWATMAAMAGTIPVALAVMLNGFALYLSFR